ncbi:MAG TPA: hypothetical protein VN685_08065 [Rhizomicrobium sp.]|nr:hypothetical protein [Rhizomicrobium sp.]
MQDYQIRIVMRDNRSKVLVNLLPSDFAAIRRAHALLQPGQGVEVWRDGDCIYAHYSHTPGTRSFAGAERSAPRLDYEIRILKDDLQPSLIWKSLYEGDAAAIRAGVRAAAGHPLEIWRDMDCIFRAPQA